MPMYTVYGENGREEQAFQARTADGYPIVEGLRVWTNNLERGKVILPPSGRWAPSKDFHTGWWFHVELDGGGTAYQNGERVATRFKGEPA